MLGKVRNKIGNEICNLAFWVNLNMFEEDCSDEFGEYYSLRWKIFDIIYKTGYSVKSK